MSRAPTQLATTTRNFADGMAQGSDFLEKQRCWAYPLRVSMDFEDFSATQEPATEARAPGVAARGEAEPRQETEDISWPPRRSSPRRVSASSASAPIAPMAPVALATAPVRNQGHARARAGMGAIAACGGTVLGAIVLGGIPGAVAGLASVGAVRNLYRAQGIGSGDASVQSDAARSLAIGLVGVAIAGYLGYKAFTKESR